MPPEFPNAASTLVIFFLERAVPVAAEASASAWSQVPLLAAVPANHLQSNLQQHHVRLHLPVVMRVQVLNLVRLLLLLVPAAGQLSFLPFD